MAFLGKDHALVSVVADPDAMQPPAIAGMHPLDLPTIGVVRIVGVVVVIEREAREDAEAAAEAITEVIAIMIMVTIDETVAVVIAIDKSAAIVTIPQPRRSRLASAAYDA